MHHVRIAGSTLIAAAAVALCGCSDMLDQDRPAASPRPPTTAAAVATGERDRPQPLSGMTPPPKPFLAIGDDAPPPMPAQPSPLLIEHASLDSPIPLSAYGRQPTHGVEDFPLGPALTLEALRRRLGPPAGMAGVEDRWFVYRLTGNREMWLNFAGGDGPLLAADLIRGAENGYVRDRLYPQR